MPDEDGTYPNVYKRSEKSILKDIFYYSFSSVYDVESSSGKESGLKEVFCRKAKDHIGSICTDDVESVSTYIYAYYLFINTVQGNRCTAHT